MDAKTRQALDGLKRMFIEQTGEPITDDMAILFAARLAVLLNNHSLEHAELCMKIALLETLGFPAELRESDES